VAVPASAGKNDSMASSATVMSSGVPKTAVVADAQRDGDVAGSGKLDLGLWLVAGVGAELVSSPTPTPRRRYPPLAGRAITSGVIDTLRGTRGGGAWGVYMAL